MMRTVNRFVSLVVGLIILSLGQITMSAQMVNIEDAIQWKKDVKAVNDTEFDIVFTATLSSGWHLYGTDIEDGGPQKTELNFDKIEGVELIGALKEIDKAESKFDEMFGMNITYFELSASFVQRFKITKPNYKVEAYIRYMVCNDGQCLPPTNFEFTLEGKAAANTATSQPTEAKPAVEEPKPVVEEPQSNQIAIAQDKAKTEQTASLGSDLWASVVEELKALGDEHTQSSSWLTIFVLGFLGGIIALITPCVWPMIPMTVSFFLKRTKDRKKAISDALIYGISIIVIYLVLGLSVTAIFGAGALNALATNAIFNIIFFLLLVFFAISFFGAFDLVLPASWTNKIDQKADSTTGLLSIFFMAFTLVLVSFSCTGPIIGTLLVEAAANQGSMIAPAIGMFGFSLALALPFALFAIFPNMLQSMPKSGGWLNSVKVVLGFLELALAFKFLSVADLAYGWHILDRETFIAIWIVIFTLLGFYLLGKLRFAHDTAKEHSSVLGLFLAIISLSFAVYMVPGLWGAPLRSISAFAPPIWTQDFNLYDGSVHAKFDDYEAGMDYAKKNNKAVFIDFSGFGCTNCRKMEAAVWTNAEVKQILEKDYVLITLMVDDKHPLPETVVVQENGKDVKLRTIGDKWSYLQRVKFGKSSQPCYIALDHEGKPLTVTRGYDEDVKEYIKFLKGGLEKFKAQQEEKQ